MDPRPAPTSSVELASTPLAQVFGQIATRRFTGTVAINSPAAAGDLAGETLIAFEDSAVTQVRLPQTLDPLGFILYEQGVIDSAQWNESLSRIARAEGLQGDVLVKMRACTARDVEEGLREQSRRKLLRLFALAQGRCEIFRGADLLAGYGGARFGVPLLPLLWRGVRANPRHAAVDPVLRSLGSTTLRLRPGATEVDGFGVDDPEQRLLNALRKTPMTVAQFVTYDASVPTARALMFLLIATRQIEAAEAAAPKPAPAATPTATPAATATSTPTGVVYKISGVIPRAESPARAVSGTDLPAVRDGGVSGSVRPPPMVTPAPSMLVRIAQAEARLKAMEDQSYFEMLNLPPGADVQFVHAAFLALARTWHPDAAPAGAIALRDVHAKIFAMLSEAEDTLRDPSARERYLVDARAGFDTPRTRRTRVAVASVVSQAQASIRQGRFGEAESLARNALELEPNAREALLVLAQALLGGRPASPPDEAVKVLTTLANTEPQSDQAHYLLGTVARRLGAHNRATAHFQKAWKINPNNVDALRELRLSAYRKRTTGTFAPTEPGETRVASGAEAGIFGRIFGRKA